MKRVKKPRPSASPTAHECAILAVDPGETSGWAIWDRGALLFHGHCDVFGSGPVEAIDALFELEGPHVLVVERPFRVRFANQTGIGTGERIWRKRAEDAHIARRTVRVWPNSWRARVLGKVAGMKRDAVRAVELATVRAMFPTITDPHPDECAAIMIGRWATFAGEVAEKLPKRRARKAG